MATGEKVFVTGATGFIGTRLVEALTRQGRRVRALSRRADPPAPPGLGYGDHGPLDHHLVELVRGDVTDRESLARGVEGCSEVFHLAAHATNWDRNPAIFDRVNTEGTLHVLRAAKAAGVRKVVWTSSQLSLGPARPGDVPDEATPRISDRCFTDYERTKVVSEARVLRGVREEGFPVVIALPTRVFGPGLLTEANSATQLLDQYDRGLVPVLPNLGRNVGNWVLVDDVVRGLLLAMERGRVGERYLLGGENASLKEFFRTFDRVTGRRHWQVPLFRILPIVASHLLLWQAKCFGTHPRFTPGWVKTFFTEWPCRCDKAERELGYRWTPLAEALEITWQWLLQVRRELACNRAEQRHRLPQPAAEMQRVRSS